MPSATPTDLHFTCPTCGAQHDRGHLGGPNAEGGGFRCLRCGYAGPSAPPTPTLNAAMARLAVVLDEIGAVDEAADLRAGYPRKTLRNALSLAAGACAKGMRGNLERGDTHAARRIMGARMAAEWLSTAVLKLTSVEAAEKIAAEALRFLAWPEAMATLDAVEGLCAADLSVGGLLVGLSSALDAYQVAIGKGDVVAARRAQEAEDEVAEAEADATATAPDPHEIVTVSASFSGMREDVSRWLVGLGYEVDTRRGAGRNDRWRVELGEEPSLFVRLAEVDRALISANAARFDANGILDWIKDLAQCAKGEPPEEGVKRLVRDREALTAVRDAARAYHAADVEERERSPLLLTLLAAAGAIPHDSGAAGGAGSWLVLVQREGGQLDSTTATFGVESNALDFYGRVSAAWTDSYLCRVIAGPHVERKDTPEFTVTVVEGWRAGEWRGVPGEDRSFMEWVRDREPPVEDPRLAVSAYAVMVRKYCQAVVKDGDPCWAWRARSPWGSVVATVDPNRLCASEDEARAAAKKALTAWCAEHAMLHAYPRRYTDSAEGGGR